MQSHRREGWGACRGEAEPRASCATCRRVGPGDVVAHAGHGDRSQPDPSLCPQSQDAGTYTCIAENPAGRARRRIHLSILALPAFTTLPGDRSLRLGDRLWLRCVARGSPTPRIGWTVNDRPVTGRGLLGTLGGGGGRAGGEPHSSEEEVGVHRCCGFWVSGLGLVQGNEVNPHAATCDQSHVRPWQEATCDKRPRDREGGPCSSPALLPPCGPLNKPLSWGALSPHLGPRCYLERHRACRIYSSAQEMSAKR